MEPMDRKGLVVHAGGIVQVQKILKLYHAQVGYAGVGGSDKMSHNLCVFCFFGQTQITPDMLLRFLIAASVPAQGGLIVVSADVYNAVFIVIMRQISAVVASEAELQHLHAWIPCL